MPYSTIFYLGKVWKIKANLPVYYIQTATEIFVVFFWLYILKNRYLWIDFKRVDLPVFPLQFCASVAVLSKQHAFCINLHCLARCLPLHANAMCEGYWCLLWLEKATFWDSLQAALSSHWVCREGYMDTELLQRGSVQTRKGCWEWHSKKAKTYWRIGFFTVGRKSLLDIELCEYLKEWVAQTYNCEYSTCSLCPKDQHHKPTTSLTDIIVPEMNRPYRPVCCIDQMIWSSAMELKMTALSYYLHSSTEKHVCFDLWGSS